MINRLFQKVNCNTDLTNGFPLDPFTLADSPALHQLVFLFLLLIFLFMFVELLSQLGNSLVARFLGFMFDPCNLRLQGGAEVATWL